MQKILQQIKQAINYILVSFREVTSMTSHIKFYRNLRVVGISASATLAALMTLAAFPITFKGNVAEALAGDATASTTSLTMALDHTSANLAIMVDNFNGTFAASASAEQASFSIITNNYTGYTLSISASDDTKKLNNTVSGAYLDSIASAINADTFNTSSYNGKWGYLPSKYDSESNTNFLPGPTTLASTLDTTSAANAISNDYTIGLGARVDYSNPAGTYTSTFILTALGNPVAYSINYDKGNTADTVTNLPSTQSSSTSQTTVTLSSNIPNRSGYKFIGWCDGAITTDSSTGADTCSGTTYNPNGGGIDLSFGIDQTTTNIVTLHAMWKPATMQTWNGCSAMNSGDKVTLPDARDGQEYEITKIGDYCIMTDNLAIGTTGNGTISAAGSNFTGTDITPDYTDYSHFSSSYSSNKVLQANATNGAYYNYCLASAGTVCSSAQTDTTQDICPANWKMPTYTTWEAIRGTSGSAALFDAQLGGYMYYSSANPSGTSYGYYWSSSTYTSNNYSYYGRATKTSFSSSSYMSRYYGMPIRCVFNPAVTVTVNRGTGISGVGVNGDATGATATYTGHMEDQITINATPSTGYGPSYTWTKNSGLGTLTSVSTNIESNTFTLGPGDASLSLSATSGVAVIIKVSDVVSSNVSSPTVTLNGVTCGTTDGCLVTGLTPNTDYTLTASVPTGFTFSSWNTTDGTVGNVDSTSTTFRASSSSSGTAATITLNASPNQYSITFKTVNANSIVFDGTAYANNKTTLVDYGSTYVVHGSYASRYTFKSWAATAGIVDNNAYQTTTYTVTGAATITLTGQNVSTTIQSVTPSTCTSTPTPGYDTRDNEVYWFAKLADGNCWMLDNMRLGGTSTISLSSSNSNIANSWSMPKSGTVCFGTGSCTGTNGVTGNGYTVPAINIDKKDIAYTGLVSFTTPGSKYGGGSGKYGVFYNYCAMSAGTYCMNSSVNGQDAGYDICPKNWRIPAYVNGNTEFKVLYQAYGSDATKFYTALSLPGTGLFDTDGQYKYNGWGIYPTSARTTSYRFWRFDVDRTYIDQHDYGDRSFGLPVRCLLRTTSDAISGTMQDAPSKNVYANGSTGTLTDARDNQTYTVAQINGNLWMTRNLAIGCNGSGATYGSSVSSKRLSTSSSNVSATWNTPTTALGASYTDPMMVCSSSYGAWYNFAAASAGTIVTSAAVSEAQYDICPSGWRLPSVYDFDGINYSAYLNALNFKPEGGWYRNGTYNTQWVSWYSRTPYDASSGYPQANRTFTYDYTNKYWNTYLLDSRVSGLFIRCIRAY